MHVPDHNLLKYRQLMNISRQLESLGSSVSGLNGEVGMAHASTLWRLASHYQKQAQLLRVPGKKEGGE